MRYDDKVAVITGASRGIGAGMARVFADHGLRLGLCARSEPTAPAGAETLTRALDVTDPDAVEAFAAEVERALGPIDLWINNAGILEPIAPARDIAAADFHKLIEINLLGSVYGSQTFVRHRRRHGGGGVLINISSGAALNGYAGWSAYCASKAAVDRFSEALALEEAEQGIRVHAVAPGVVDTGMQALIRSTSADRFPMVDKFRQLKANEAFNSPEFVAETLLAYAFDPARRPPDVVARVPNER